MADRDFSTLSDKELDAIIAGADVTQAPPGAGSQVLATRNAAVAQKMERAPKPFAEEAEPSALRRGIAAFGGRIQEPFVGLAEKAQLAFPGSDPTATLQRVGDERTARREALRQLEETPAGQFGGFAGQAVPFALAPPRAGAQAVLAGALGTASGGADRPTSFLSEMSTSGTQGAADAVTTGAVMKGVQLGGKAIAGARGKYNYGGEGAMALDDAAARLGLPKPTIGQLDPMAPDALRAHPELVHSQAERLSQRMGAQRQVPDPAGGTMNQVVPGGMLKAGVEDAINARKAEARAMYTAVDDYIAQNNLPNISPNYTINTLQSIAKRYVKPGQAANENKIFKMLDAEDPQAFAWLKAAGSPKAARAAGMDFTSYQDARTLVNGVLSDLRAIKPVNRKNWQNDAVRDLEDLITAMDNDANRWATANSSNQEAVDLFNRAKEFYAKVAAPATQNEMARKMATRQSKGSYESVERMYADIINPANRSLVDRLLPTASRETQDMLNVMQNLPDVGTTVAKGAVPSSASRSGLTALAAGAAGHPGLALMELAPGLRWLSSQRPTKKIYFGREPTSRALGPLGQYASEPLSDRTQKLLSLPQD